MSISRHARLLLTFVSLGLLLGCKKSAPPEEKHPASETVKANQSRPQVGHTDKRNTGDADSMPKPGVGPAAAAKPTALARTKDSPAAVAELKKRGFAVDDMNSDTGNIRSIDTSRPTASDDDLKYLAELAELKELGSLERCRITDDGLPMISQLSCLRRLTLNSSEITNAGLAHLAGKTDLTALSLSNMPKVNDAGLQHLSGLTRLEKLTLFNTGVCGSGFEALGQLQQITRLNLNGSPIADEHLAKLLPLKKLEHLTLTSDTITDKALGALKGLPALKELWINQSRITGTGFTELAPLATLKLLVIQNSPVDDAGLMNLTGLSAKGIKLRFYTTRITPAGLAAFKKQRPDIDVTVR